MNIRLRETLSQDLVLIDKWSTCGDARAFMSRYTPRSLVGTSWSRDLTCWCMIVVEEREVGTVWLERSTMEETVADLGILLHDPNYRGRGIGREAMRLIEERIRPTWRPSAIRLRVREENERAIRCYEAAGYCVTATEDKEVANGKNIRALEMTKILKEPNKTLHSIPRGCRLSS